MKKDKIQTALGFITYWLLIGGTAAALMGAESEEFGVLCRAILAVECVLWSIVMLTVLAMFTPDRPRASERVRRRPKNPKDDYCLTEREPDPRRLGYVTPDEIRRAAGKSPRR